MEHALADLLGPALVPELGADVTAGAAGNAHAGLVAVAADRALPDQLTGIVLDDHDLAVIAAALTVIALGVEFGVHDVVVDILHHSQNSGNVVLHVGNLDVADGTAGGELLEIRLEFQFVEGVDLLSHVYVIAVGDVVFVRDALDDAEALLQALGKLVGRGLHGCAVYRVADALRGAPLGALVVETLHDLETELPALVRGVGLACHAHAHLIETCVAQADRAVVVVEQTVDLLTFFQACDGTVLPEDRGDIGDSAEQSFMAAAQGAVAELQALLQNFPELVHISVRGAGDIDEIDGDDALVKASIVLVLAVFAQAHGVRGQEGPASHTGINIAVFVLLHHLCGDVVGHHALGGALCGQFGQAVISGTGDDIVLVQHIDELGESGCDPDALLVLDTLHALDHDLFDQHGKVIACTAGGHLIQVHVHGDKGSLAVAGHQGNELILDSLDSALDLLGQTELDDLVDDLVDHRLAAGFALFHNLLADLPAAHINEGSQVRQGEGLAAVLVGGNLGDDLCRHIAGGIEAVGLLDQGLADDGAVLQHVLKVDKVAVVLLLGIIIGIVEVDDTLFVGFHDVGGQKDTAGQILGDLTGHIIALRGINDRVLVGILLLDFLIDLLDQGKDPVVGRIGLSGKLAAETIADIFLRNFVAPHLHDAGLDHILDILDVHRVRGLLHLLGNLLGDRDDLILIELMDRVHLFVGLADRIDDLGEIKSDLLTVSLDNIGGDCHTRILCHIFSTSLFFHICV